MLPAGLRPRPPCSRAATGRSRNAIVKNVIYITLNVGCRNIPRARPVPALTPLCTGKPVTAGVVAFRRRGGTGREEQCRLLVESGQFLPFGLTLSLSQPTVTVRNRYRKRRLAGKPRKNAI